MKIVYINHYAGGVSYGMSMRPEYLAEIWAEQDHNVTIIGAGYTHLRHTQPKLNGLSVTHKQDKITRLWLWSPRYQGNSIGRFLNMMIFSLLLILRAPFATAARDGDVYIASSTHPFEIFGVKLLALLNGGKVIFELHDIWPESLIELGSLKKYHPFTWLLKLLRPLCYRWADGVVSMLPNAQSHITQYFNASKKIAIIPNGVSPGLIKRLANSQTKFSAIDMNSELYSALQKTKMAEKLCCVYTGYLGPQNAMRDMLEVSKQFLHKIDFHLIGDGPSRKELEAEFGAQQNVFFHGLVDLKSAQACQQLADVLYIGWQNKEIYKYGVTPNKLFEYMAVGKPIIQALSYADNLVTQAEAGIACEAENHDAIAHAFNELLSLSNADRSTMGQRGKKFVIENYAYTYLADKFLNFINELTDKESDSNHA